MASKTITDILGGKAEDLMNYKCKVDKSQITVPSPTHVDDIWTYSNRSNRVLLSLQNLLNHGRLGGSGYWHKKKLLHFIAEAQFQKLITRF